MSICCVRSSSLTLTLFVSRHALAPRVHILRTFAWPIRTIAFAMAQPTRGDRILVLKQHWLHLILSGKKTLEIRGSRLKPGPCFLGYRGKIYASATLATPIAIENVGQWLALRKRHGVLGDTLPYRKTFALPVRKLQKFKETIPYVHKRGAIGIVRYDTPID